MQTGHSGRRRLLSLALSMAAAIGAMAGSSSLRAQDYPNKPLRFVVASAPGGVVDIRARRFGQRLSELLKQPIVVENKPGASTTIGAEAVARAAPDGYTALFGGNTEVVYAPALGMKLRYDPVKDFIPVAQFTEGFPVFVVNSGFGPKTLPEVISWARANPGKLLCGSAGHGSIQHFSCELLARSAGIKLQTVAYKASGAMLLATAAGEVHISIGFLAEVDKQYIQTNRVIPLAWLAPRRIDPFPNLPTMAELGHRGFEMRSWVGLFLPAGSPAEAVNRLNAEVTKVVREPEFVKWLKETGSEIVTPTPEQFRQFTHAELLRWTRMSDEFGIKAENQ